MRDAVIDRQSLYSLSNVNQLFLNVIYHLDNTPSPMILFAVHVLTCRLEFATKMVFLISWLETQVTGQYRSLQVNYVFSTKTDIGPVW